MNRTFRLILLFRWRTLLELSFIMHHQHLTSALFFQGYVMDRRIGFIEGRAKMPNYNAYIRHRRRVTHPPPPTHTDYLLNLHISTWAKLPLRSPASLHVVASSAIRLETVNMEGVAPSKTTSFWWRHKHQHIRPRHDPPLSHVTSPRGGRRGREPSGVGPTSREKQPTPVSPLRNPPADDR